MRRCRHEAERVAAGEGCGKEHLGGAGRNECGVDNVVAAVCQHKGVVSIEVLELKFIAFLPDGGDAGRCLAMAR